MAATSIHYTKSIATPTSAQEHFIDSYDIDDPAGAIQDYARLIRLHTKAQMDAANTLSHRHRGNVATPAVVALSPELSAGSVDSLDSRA